MNATAPSIFDRQHFGQRMGAGRHPALLVVDFTVGFNDPSAFGGGNISEAITETIGLLARVRERGWPVAHTRIVYAEDGSDANVHCLKVPRLRTLTESNPQSHFVPELQPLPGEIIVTKRLPSAFFGTDLAGMLIGRGVDTVFVAGCTTSGCVRASTLDAMCHGLRPMVVRECVGDRSPSAHQASLFDLDKKYADVVALDAALALIDSLATAS
jgi:maleamate amidohydrolase